MKEGCEWPNAINLLRRVTHLSAAPRLSDLSLETQWREDAEQLRYVPLHFLIGYHAMGRYWISLALF
ncbi:hypothetical protein TNCV_4736681 [Trichonephila clavipes]|nr:hypothetical protein TNCV_4736681 [Trichonephila clavipes]